MQRSRRARLHLVVLTTFTLLGASLLPGNSAPASADPPNPPGPPPLPSVVPVCPGPAPLQQARCHSERRTDIQGQRGVTPNVTPSGYGPTDLQSAYKLSPPSGAAGTGPLVAIVDAYDDPSAESDLAIYRGQFGLGPCTTPNGCFRKVNQNGVAGPYPSGNSGWAQEISLDLDMVSAICPNCK